MTNGSVWLGRILLAAAAAGLSASGAVDGWAMGAAFGVVILTWSVPRPRQLLGAAGVAFVLCSALIGEVASRIALSGIFNAGFWGGRSGRALAAAVLAGTVLLPVAHAVLLKAGWGRAVLAVVGVALTCVACVAVVPLVGRLSLGSLVVIWQGAYLAFFFIPWPVRHPAFNPE